MTEAHEGELHERFEAQRPRLRSVAYRMLGSLSEADDAVQETWLRLGRTDPDDIDNLDAWLTTVVARVCLNLLRTRRNRREVPVDVHVPEPVVSPDGPLGPEDEALLADSVGLALMVVLDTLAPAERVSFVLHDLFAVPFEEVAELLDRTPASVRQLASRARRRVQGRAPVPDPDLARQRAVVDAFFAAARDGDLDGLVAVLDPEVVLRADGGASKARQTVEIRTARVVAAQAAMAAKLAPFVQPALVNGAAGVVVVVNGKAFSVMAFTVTGGRIAAIDVLYDPDRLTRLDLSHFGGT
ncbi:RNA polymerase sigma factor SigJ [Terrabacter sp. MAHUQ-38]|uniref:RNA polymerase sigma factor SigJ n=1 Tax=unclassified Terrabacter TaxID=2630222 RepID=UPI00351C8001